MPSYKYPQLNDKDWLHQKYVVEQLSTVKIGELVGAKRANSVRQALIRQGIPVRSVSDGLTCNRENDFFVLNQEVIEGCLLGDGFLRAHNPDSDNSYPYFSKRNINYDHIAYVAKNVFSKNWKQRVRENNEKFEARRYVIFSLRSYSHKELKPLFNRWYIDGTKIVPEDIDLTPTVLLHWFMDDGNSYQRRKESKTKQVDITFCCESFSKSEQIVLCDKLKDGYGIDSSIRKCQWGSGWRIHLSQNPTKIFYDVIGKCPVKSMEYKWKHI